MRLEVQREYPDTNPDQLGILQFRRIFLEHAAWTMASDLVKLFEQAAPDLVIRETNAFGGWAAAERSGIPHATAGAPTTWSPERWHAVAEASIQKLCQHVGIQHPATSASLYRYLDLVSLPPVLIMENDHLSPTSHFIRPSVFDQSGEEQLPGWVSRLPDRPTVYGTLGTTNFSRIPGAFEALAQGVAGEPYNVILTVGREREPEEVDPHAENVRVERYIPQTMLLPHCDAVICHGGFGTTMAALAHGLPLVVMPLGADQFDNAERARQIGAGIIVGPDERTPERVREAIRRVLDDPSYRENAERFRDEVQLLPGLDYAVELLERLAKERQPILREEHEAQKPV